MKKNFIGIDIQVRRDCCYAVINNESTLIDSGWFSNVETDVINLIKKWTKSGEVEIGIDAPRLHNLGLSEQGVRWVNEVLKKDMAGIVK
jgi:hypothetical protein